MCHLGCLCVPDLDRVDRDFYELCSYGYQYGGTLWVDKLGLEIISDFSMCQHWEKILGQQ